MDMIRKSYAYKDAKKVMKKMRSLDTEEAIEWFINYMKENGYWEVKSDEYMDWLLS